MSKFFAMCLTAVAVFAESMIALAEEATVSGAAGYMDISYIADQGLWDRFVTYAPNWLVVGVPVLVSLMLAFRGISEALWIIAAKTQNKTDDKIAEVLGRVSEVLAKVTGMIGVGMPKAQLMQKAEKIAAKELADGKDSVGSTIPPAA